MLNKLHFLFVSIFYWWNWVTEKYMIVFLFWKLVTSFLTEKNWLERRSILAVMWHSVLPDLKTPFEEEKKNKKEAPYFILDRLWKKKRLNQAYKGEEYGTIIKERFTKYKMWKVSIYSSACNSSSFICCYFILPAAFFSGDKLEDSSISSSSHFSSSGVLVLLLSQLKLDLMYIC